MGISKGHRRVTQWANKLKSGKIPSPSSKLKKTILKYCFSTVRLNKAKAKNKLHDLLSYIFCCMLSNAYYRVNITMMHMVRWIIPGYVVSDLVIPSDLVTKFHLLLCKHT